MGLSRFRSCSSSTGVSAHHGYDELMWRLFRAVYTGTRPGLTPAIRAGKRVAGTPGVLTSQAFCHPNYVVHTSYAYGPNHHHVVHQGPTPPPTPTPHHNTTHHNQHPNTTTTTTPPPHQQHHNTQHNTQQQHNTQHNLHTHGCETGGISGMVCCPKNGE